MRLLKRFAVPGLFVTAILFGSLTGATNPNSGALFSGWVDGTVLLLIGLLFFGDMRRIRAAPRFLVLAILLNFAVIPFIRWGIASMAFGGREPELFIGLVVYSMAPCTDWFLAFTKMTRGNVELGAVLLPINMIVQLLLFPVYLRLFAAEQASVDLASTFNKVVQWFVVPVVIGVLLRLAARLLLTEHRFAFLLKLTGSVIPAVVTLLIIELFAANIAVILAHASSFVIILIAAIVFFLITYGVAEAASRLFRLGRPQKALLVMTTAARNAPLMLALTTVTIPGQPLVYAAIIVGMLIEFPHLTALRTLLLRRHTVKSRTAERPAVASARP